MSSKTVSVSLITALSLLSSASAADIWYSGEDTVVRSWDNASAWKEGAVLPTQEDNVKLNAASLAVPNYLRITDGVTALAASLRIGEVKVEGDPLVGLKIEQGGTLNLKASGFYNFFVGDSGRGSFVIDGGTVAESGWNLVIGNNAGSYGEVTINPGSSVFAPAPQSGAYTKGIIVGLNGTGRLTTFADFGFPKLELRVGGNTGGWSRFFAAESAVTAYDCQIGSIAYYGNQLGIYNVLTPMPGYGEMVLSNATLKIVKSLPANTDAQLVIGRYAGGYGILRGCGVVQGSSLDSNNVRLWMNEGRIIGDGFGEEKTLDLNTVISIRNNTSSIPADTTNGWYAVNKGAVLYPRVYFNTDEANTVVGAWNGDTEPSFVNSVGVSIVASEQWDKHLRGGFFASDRSDIHADSLPAGPAVAGVWKLGMTGSVGGTDVKGYSTVSLDFRYDQSAVRLGSTLQLYRWTGSAWEKVAEKAADSTCRISVSGLTPPASYDGIYNIGTFALLNVKPGLVVIVK